MFAHLEAYTEAYTTVTPLTAKSENSPFSLRYHRPETIRIT